MSWGERSFFSFREQGAKNPPPQGGGGGMQLLMSLIDKAGLYNAVR